MTITANANLVEQAKIVTGLAPILPSSSTPDYVSLKGYERMTAIILVDNATTVTGSAITVKQATTVAAAGEKAVAFTEMFGNIDTGASDALVSTAVTSDTFTTDGTNAKNLMYVIEITHDMLDVDNNFDCVRIGTANATAAIVSVCYILWPAKDGKSTPLTAIVD